MKSFYKGISAVFFIYSVDSRESFLQLKSWSQEVKEYAHEEAVLFLIGSKGDIQDKREVQQQEAEGFLKSMGGEYFVETSAKTGLNIDIVYRMRRSYLSGQRISF